MDNPICPACHRESRLFLINGEGYSFQCILECPADDPVERPSFHPTLEAAKTAFIGRKNGGGAVDLDACPSPRGRCQCAKCAVCGQPKHSGVHGPKLGEGPGSEPWGHVFTPKLGER